MGEDKTKVPLKAERPGDSENTSSDWGGGMGVVAAGSGNPNVGL